MDLLERADRLWRGDLPIEDHHPWAAEGEFAEVAADTAFLHSFANVAAFRTGAGLLLVDTGSPFTPRLVHRRVRSWTAERLDTAVFSHGHIDHVFGVQPFDEEAAAGDFPAPRVVAHEALPGRFDRYRLTAGYNTAINRRQFSAGDDFTWPTEYRYPDVTYRERLSLDVGGLRVELHHDRGETDDHTWTWVPERRVLCTGDLVIWACPNAGNPQKVQRYPGDWAAALRTMAALGAEVLLPGHGLPVLGVERIRRTLLDAADLLQHLHDATVAMMNRGASLDEIAHTVRPPPQLISRPYLRPVYDDPEFIVRNVWRLYGGWYDGNPARLLPARDDDLAAEVAALAGGPRRLAERARELLAEGRPRLATHLAVWAARAGGGAEAEVVTTAAEVLDARAREEPSLMAQGIFTAAADALRGRGNDGSPPTEPS